MTFDDDSSISVVSFTIADLVSLAAHANLHPQLVTDVPPVNLVAVWVLKNRGNVSPSLH